MGTLAWLFLVWPLLSLLLTLPALVLLYRRDGWLRLTTVFAVYASILYAAGLVCFALYPLPSGDSGPGITYGIPPILDPPSFVHDIARDGVPAVLQLLLNVVLFVPLGFIAKTLLRLGLLPAAGISLVATGLIETAQLTGLFGAYPFAFRTFDVNDLMCNMLGGLIGWALGRLAVALTRRGPEGLPPVTHGSGLGQPALPVVGWACGCLCRQIGAVQQGWSQRVEPRAQVLESEELLPAFRRVFRRNRICRLLIMWENARA